MTIRIKVVSDDDPNAEGEWIVIKDERMPLEASWKSACDHVARHCPEGKHIVAMENVFP